jgi:hypothetical protein
MDCKQTVVCSTVSEVLAAFCTTPECVPQRATRTATRRPTLLHEYWVATTAVTRRGSRILTAALVPSPLKIDFLSP